MIYKFVNFPLILEIKEGALDEIESIIHKNNLHFEKPIVITGEQSGKIIKKYMRQFPFEDGEWTIIKDITPELLTTLRSKLITQKFDLIIASGGGRIIDLGKYLSNETMIPVISVPTLISSDAIASPISIIRLDNKYKKFGSSMPIGVIIDLNIIKNSPSIYILSGLGDLISNISASYDWILSNKRKKERIDHFSRALAYLPAINILNSFETYSSIKDLKFLEDLAYGLVFSGISMNIAKSSRPASGSEHNISHALDIVLGETRKLHGLQVGFATLLTVYLQNQIEVYNKIEQLYTYFRFPKSFKEIGIEPENFKKALFLAPSLRDRYTILNEINLDDAWNISKDIYK